MVHCLAGAAAGSSRRYGRLLEHARCDEMALKDLSVSSQAHAVPVR